MLRKRDETLRLCLVDTGPTRVPNDVNDASWQPPEYLSLSFVQWEEVEPVVHLCYTAYALNEVS